jgi:carboxypeptidase C (cathepsin A)
VQTTFYLENLLERGVKVLIFVGTLDWICNWVGNHRMTQALDWYGAEDFEKQELRPWSRVKGMEFDEPAGLYKSSGDLAFLTIYDAGHMVSRNQ